MPLKGEFNGSLWTLPIEFRLYLYLAAGWLVFALLPAIRVRALALIVALAAAAFLVTIVRGRLSGAAFNAANIRIFMFLAGSGLYLWRDRVPLNRAFLFAALAALLLASFDKSAFFVAYALLLAPLVLHLAYLPKGRVRAFNRSGDFSYGVYIWAFPIQQTLAYLFPGIPLVALIAVAAVLTVAVAALSWFLIEERALALKEAAAKATERALDRSLTLTGLKTDAPRALTRGRAQREAAKASAGTPSAE